MDATSRKRGIHIELYKVIIMKEALKELGGIYYYIAIHLKEKNIAKKLINKILNEIFDLEYMPRKFKLLRQYKETEIRLRIVKNYLIIYQIDIKKKKVHILHIFYSKRDYLKLI